MPQLQGLDDLKILLEKSNDRLRNSEARIRTLVETIPLGLLITTHSGAIESASPACLTLFNCSYGEIHARNISELFLLDAAMSADPSLLVSSNASEVIARRRDGSEFPASIKVGTFAGSTPGLLIVVEDITAKHELEKMKEDFLSMMTHDLRTPLTSVRCFLELITAGVYDGRLDELKRRSTGITNDTTRLINMVSSLLNLHKLEAGRLMLMPEVVVLDSLITKSVDSVASYADIRGIELLTKPTGNDLLVSADSDYTVQVMVNLLSNAIKFSPKGSQVAIAVEVRSESVKVEIRDQGRGIPKEVQSRLFNRFEQARLSDARVEGGSGLGLAISKAIIEEEGGTIGVESEPGNGCTFWFTLRRETPD